MGLLIHASLVRWTIASFAFACSTNWASAQVVPPQQWLTDEPLGVAEWTMLGSRSSTGTSCYATTTFRDGTKLEYVFDTSDARKPRAKVQLQNRDWASLNSLPPDEGLLVSTIPVTLEFVGAKEVWRGPFIVHPQGRLNPEPTIYMWFSKELGPIMNGFLKATSLKVETAGKVVGTYPIPKSKVMAILMTQCVKAHWAESERRVENDPFRK